MSVGSSSFLSFLSFNLMSLSFFSAWHNLYFYTLVNYFILLQLWFSLFLQKFLKV